MADDVDVELAFPRRYDVDLLERLMPRRGYGRAFGFPGAVPLDPQQELAAGPIVGIRPAAGDPWIAVFDGEAYDVPPAVGARVIGWPDELSLCGVVRGTGCVVRADDPRTNFEIALWPICDVVAAADHGLVVFADFTSLVAYGRDGVAWESDRLALDDLRILGAEGHVLHLTGSAYFGGDDVETARFTLDLRTGASDDAPWRDS